MDLKVEMIDPCRRKLKISVSSERVSREIESAYERVARRAKVPGFRPGKAPRRVLELHFGAQVREDVKEKLVDESFAEALREQKIEPATAPSLDIKALRIAPGEPLRYEVDVEVWPELHVSGYSGIKAVRRKAQVGEGDVENHIKTLLERHAEYAPVEGRPLAEGDFAFAEVGREVEGSAPGKPEDVWFEVSRATFIPGFCDEVIGMNPGETRSFTLTVPADAEPENVRGKKVSFTVTLREIKRKNVPELNDEFCRELGEYATVDELRNAVRADLLRYAEAQETERVLDQINEYLLAHIKVPLPPARVTAETVSLAEKAAARLLAQGVKKENILERKEELMAASRNQAERSLRLARIYNEIARREKIAASPEEIVERVRRIADSVKADPGKLRNSMEKEGRLPALGREIEREKVARFLLEHARIKEAKE